MDRNVVPVKADLGIPGVALLAEGVDRNSVMRQNMSVTRPVALLAEGVDRNCAKCGCTMKGVRSPSSRRAWIEIALA